MKREKATHILLTGGGTLGPVTPLFAILNEWQKVDSTVKASWIGTFTGPEKSLLAERPEIDFYPLWAPKLSRHQPWQWPLLPFALTFSFVRAWQLLKALRPDIIYTVGGFVSVPIVLAGYLQGIPSWVHQLDVEAGLANKIMGKFAKRISTTFKISAAAFSPNKTAVLGGMARPINTNRIEAIEYFNLFPEKPTLLITGGGTGAQQINQAGLAIAEDLLKDFNIIHLFGRGKMPEDLESKPGYFVTELLKADMSLAWAAADLAVVRGGLGTLIEAVAQGCPIIMVPIAGSHQEANARVVEDAKAGIVLRQLYPQQLLEISRRLLRDEFARLDLIANLKELMELGAEKIIVQESKNLLRK